MVISYYKLVGHKPVLIGTDVLAWARHEQRLEEKDPFWRQLAQTKVKRGVLVSTVFIGFDLGMGMSPKPLLFETMIFGGKHNLDMMRTSSFDDAMAAHLEMVSLAGQS